MRSSYLRGGGYVLVLLLLLPVTARAVTSTNNSDKRIALAAEEGIGSAKAGDKVPVAMTVDSIVIPESVGRVKERYQGTSDKIIIHIQDAHCNYEAQANIAKLLETLYNNTNLEFIGLEGADGRIDTSWFKAFPDEEIRKEVADYFMKKGEITGAEYLSITTDYPVYLYGVEQRDYYIQNLNAFTYGYKVKPQIEEYCGQVKGVLEELKKYVYSKDLKAYDDNVSGYGRKDISFTEYASFLDKTAKKYGIAVEPYQNVSLLLKTMEDEKKIDFSKVNQERTDLIELLEKSLPKEKFSELVVKSLAFKVSKISPQEFYGYLTALAQEAKVDMAKFANLGRYVSYIDLHGKMNAEKLFDEMDDLQWAVREKLYTSDAQRRLDTLYRNIQMVSGLVNIKLTNREYGYFSAHRDDFATDLFTPFIEEQRNTYGLSYRFDLPYEIIAKNIAELEQFYVVALKRDHALFDNTVDVMNKEGEKICALITGGFHTEGLMRLARESGISYIVVYPVITEKVESPYLQVLLNQALPTGALETGMTIKGSDQSIGQGTGKKD